MLLIWRTIWGSGLEQWKHWLKANNRLKVEIRYFLINTELIDVETYIATQLLLSVNWRHDPVDILAWIYYRIANIAHIRHHRNQEQEDIQMPIKEDYTIDPLSLSTYLQSSSYSSPNRKLIQDIPDLRRHQKQHGASTKSTRAQDPVIQLYGFHTTSWGFVETKTPLKISHSTTVNKPPVSNIPNVSK